MPDDTNVEPTGAGGTSNLPVSSGTVTDADALTKLVRGVIADELKPIKGDIGGLYSRQDKQQNAFSEFMAEFKKQKGKGLDDNAAEVAAHTVLNERAEKEQERAWRQSVSEKLNLVAPANTDNGSRSVVDAAKVFSNMGLPADNPEVAAMRVKSYKSDDEAMLDAARFIARQNAKPVPSNADLPTPQSSPAPSSPDAKVIEGKMAQLNKMYKTPSKYAKELPALEKELEAYLPK